MQSIHVRREENALLLIYVWLAAKYLALLCAYLTQLRAALQQIPCWKLSVSNGHLVPSTASSYG